MPAAASGDAGVRYLCKGKIPVLWLFVVGLRVLALRPLVSQCLGPFPQVPARVPCTHGRERKRVWFFGGGKAQRNRELIRKRYCPHIKGFSRRRSLSTATIESMADQCGPYAATAASYWAEA